MSDSVRPHRQQPTRLPHPWDSPGKNTGVGCHFLLQCMKVKSEREVAQLCRLLVTPWTAAYQAPPSMGFARQEYWGGLPLPSPIHSLDWHKVAFLLGRPKCSFRFFCNILWKNPVNFWPIQCFRYFVISPLWSLNKIQMDVCIYFNEKFGFKGNKIRRYYI